MKKMFLCMILLAGAMQGCISITGSKPVWRPSYIVDAMRPAEMAVAESGMTNSVLRLKYFRVSEPYDSRRMMVLNEAEGIIAPVDGGQYAVPLSMAFTGIARAWLADSGAFADVVDPAAVPSGNFLTLDAFIDQAGVVVDSNGAAEFRLTASIWLLPDSRDTDAMRRRFDYKVAVPLASAAPAQIASAAGQAVGEILLSLEADLF